jgi:hypothetical protein
MSDRPMPEIPAGVLTDEQVARISGGDCSINDYINALDSLKEGYEKLVDFTSYVIERVAG